MEGSSQQNKSTECTDSASIKDIELNMSLNHEDESNNFEMNDMAEELAKLRSQFRNMLTVLKTQQNTMKVAVKAMIASKKDKDTLCTNCNQSRRQLRDRTYKVNKTPLQEIEIIDDDFEDANDVHICPLCKHVEKDLSRADLFLEHVYSHFQECDEPQNGLEESSVFNHFNS